MLQEIVDLQGERAVLPRAAGRYNGTVISHSIPTGARPGIDEDARFQPGRVKFASPPVEGPGRAIAEKPSRRCNLALRTIPVPDILVDCDRRASRSEPLD